MLTRAQCPEWYADLMSSCWHKDAAMRPTFEQVCQRFIKELGVTDGSSSQVALTKRAHCFG